MRFKPIQSIRSCWILFARFGPRTCRLPKVFCQWVISEKKRKIPGFLIKTRKFCFFFWLSTVMSLQQFQSINDNLWKALVLSYSILQFRGVFAVYLRRFKWSFWNFSSESRFCCWLFFSSIGTGLLSIHAQLINYEP